MEEQYKLAKWLNGEMTAEEQKAFELEPDYLIFNRIKEYSSTLTTDSFDSEKMLKTILTAPKNVPKTIPLVQHWWFRVAAVLVLGLGLYFLFHFNATSTEIALNGKSHTFVLPDASKVVLNAGSEIGYSRWNWNNNRLLTLQGEAFFDVAKGEKFQVTTSYGTVTVLGTEFNVKQRNKRIEVTCYEGKVAVEAAGTTTLLLPGELLIINEGVRLPKKSIQTAQPEWMQAELAFWGEDLQGVLKELERQYNLRVTFESPNASQLFTGILPAKDLDTALQILLPVYHLKIDSKSSQAIHLTADAP